MSDPTPADRRDTPPDTWRYELVQVAAVAAAILEDVTFGVAHYRAAASDGRTQGPWILAAVGAERIEQDRKWGPQSHTVTEWAMILAEEIGEWAEHTTTHLPSDDGMDPSEFAAASLVLGLLVYAGAVARRWLHSHHWPDARHRDIYAREEMLDDHYYH